VHEFTRLMILNRLNDVQVELDEDTVYELDEELINYILELIEWAVEKELCLI
jgi:hypothetical protein